MYSFYTWFALSFDADAEIYYGTGKATFPVLYGSCIPMRLSLELFVFSIANGQKHWTAHQQCNQQRKDPVFCWQPDAFSVVGPRVRNSLPDFIRGPTVSTDCLSRVFRTYVFAQY